MALNWVRSKKYPPKNIRCFSKKYRLHQTKLHTLVIDSLGCNSNKFYCNIHRINKVIVHLNLIF